VNQIYCFYGNPLVNLNFHPYNLQARAEKKF